MGRPTSFAQEVADEFCNRLIQSDYGIEEICQADDLPCARTVFRWLAANPLFSQQYARAKEAQGHIQADRAIKEALTATDPQLGRLRYDARRWAASKLAPKQYGDKVVVAGDPDAPVTHQMIDARRLLPDQRDNLRQIVQAASEDVVEGEFEVKSE